MRNDAHSKQQRETEMKITGITILHDAADTTDADRALIAVRTGVWGFRKTEQREVFRLYGERHFLWRDTETPAPRKVVELWNSYYPAFVRTRSHRVEGIPDTVFLFMDTGVNKMSPAWSDRPERLYSDDVVRVEYRRVGS